MPSPTLLLRLTHRHVMLMPAPYTVASLCVQTTCELDRMARLSYSLVVTVVSFRGYVCTRQTNTSKICMEQICPNTAKKCCNSINGVRINA
jgi:hypothetical protein